MPIDFGWDAGGAEQPANDGIGSRAGHQQQEKQGPRTSRYLALGVSIAGVCAGQAASRVSENVLMRPVAAAADQLQPPLEMPLIARRARSGDIPPLLA